MPSTDLLDRFSSPDRTFGPTPLWWWSGDEVTEERISWQLERFNTGGVHNLVIINLAPRGPLYAAPTDQPMWFSERWWKLFEHTCEVAGDLDMKIWFYDQLGFSGANIPGSLTRDHPWAAGHRLVATPLHRLALDTLDTERFIAAYDERHQRYDLADLPRLQDRKKPITVIWNRRTSFDYLNPAATTLLFDFVHREFERRVPDRLGTVIPGSFQDELPPTNSWTPGLPDAFLERHGYDLLDELPALFTPDDDRAARIRTDYFAVRTQLAEDAFFRPLGQWHDKYGMMLGADQSHPARSGWPTQATQLYSDYFRTHRWYSAAGSDHNGDAKVHSSMAHLYGHRRVWMESFHSSGWGGTLEETYDWLIPFVRSGADLYNPHATYFGTFGGWFEWAPPSTDWRQPYWRHYPVFSRAVSRLCSVANWGTYVASVAVLHPATVTQALATLDAPIHTVGDGMGMLGEPFEEIDRAQRLYVELCGEGNWFDPKLGALDRAGVAFDIIDDASIQNATSDTTALAVRDQRYDTVVLPAATVLEPGTVQALVQLLDRSGTVITVGARPRLVAGLDSDQTLLDRLNSHPRLLSCDSVPDAVALLRDRDHGPTSDVPLLVRRDGDQFAALITATWPSATEHLEGIGLRTRKHFDRSRYADRREIMIPGQVTDTEVWDPVTGSRTPVSATQTADGSRVVVQLDGSPALFLVWRLEHAPQTPDTPAAASPLRQLAELSNWTGELLPTLDNRWGDLARPAGAALERLQLWTFDWAETSDDSQPTNWSPTRATFGQLVRCFGPVAEQEAPEPVNSDAAVKILSGDDQLAPDYWAVVEYSASRGREREVGQLGNKSLVYEEFVHTDTPDEGEVSVVRAVVGDLPSGQVDLVVGSGAAKRIWWNGTEVTPDEQDYYAITEVDVLAEGNVLEYRVGASQNHSGRGPARTLGSFFTLAETGTFAVPPLMITHPPVDGPTPLVYRKAFEVRPGLSSASLIVGAHATTTVRIDDRTIAVQARTELYEDQAGVSPRFFEHDISPALTPGQHVLQLDVDAFPGAEYVYVDLAMRHDDGIRTIGTDASWTTSGPSGEAPITVLPGGWSELQSARAARRQHPLPGAHWLRGEPEVGQQVLPISVSDTPAIRTQWYKITFPAGTTKATLPTTGEPVLEMIDVEGASIDYDAEVPELVFAEPLTSMTDVTLRLTPRQFHRAGAAWEGPLQVTTAPAPIQLGNWQDIGLSAWSGGVAYRCTVDPTAYDSDSVLMVDLGDLRGTAEVLVDGDSVGTAFCGPFRFDLGERHQPFELTVIIYNTLGPFLYESTPTEWVLDGQLRSGLIGPVTLLSK